MAKASASDINKANKIATLSLIREREAISRADLARLTGLSAPTITRVVDSLIHGEKLVVEKGPGESSGGRRPNLVAFDGENHYIIGVDLGTTTIAAVLANLNAQAIAEAAEPTRKEAGLGDVMRRTAELIERLIRQSGIARRKICGIGLAVAGLVNRQRRILEVSPVFQWKDVDVAAELRRYVDLPVIFDNVVRVMALGELWYGEGGRFRDFICLNVGYGIGAGIVANGQLFYGSRGMSGEIGHATMDPASEAVCECGNRGCLEALSSGHAIATAARQALAAGEPSALACPGMAAAEISAERVAQAAAQGDALAQRIFRQAAERIGLAIACMMSVFNPEAVFIGGGVARAGDLLFDPIRRVVEQRAIDRVRHGVAILPASHGSRSAAVGALALILNEILHLNIPACREG